VGRLADLLARRTAGEPLAWITGSVIFGGLRLCVDAGVFVPRPHSEPLASRAAELLPNVGTAVDLCTGSGAVAAVLRSARPNATVLATDVDQAAAACARGNGVAALLGDLDAPVPPTLLGRVDVLTAVVPYVPSEELHLLPRDVLAHEPRLALDGGPGGTALLDRAATASGRWLAPGGTVLLEIGGNQASAIAATLGAAGLTDVRVHRDADGQDRAIEARREAEREPDKE
jgi:release factor glutamine methyltransferase